MKENDNLNGAPTKNEDLAFKRNVTPNGKPGKRVEFNESEVNGGHEVATVPTPVPVTKTGSATKKNLMRVVMGAAVLAVATGAGVYYERYQAPFESTDDAFIEGDATPIAPQVAGQVVRLLVGDNQLVKAGDLLLEIDPRGFQAKVDQAKANLSAAKSRRVEATAKFAVDEATVNQEKANVTAAEADARHAAADYGRYRAVGVPAVSESRLELAGTEARSTAARVEAARGKETAAEAQSNLDRAGILTATAEVEMNEAALRQAELDLSYTRVTAPVPGFVTHRSVNDGAYAQQGQDLLAIMPREVWIVANFKETQLTHMRPGQPVDVGMDAYPGVHFKGRVDGIQAGTGARFSLLPAENATGNYVKVVQRVPVKIVLDDLPDARYVLGAGMSVVPRVRVN